MITLDFTVSNEKANQRIVEMRDNLYGVEDGYQAVEQAGKTAFTGNVSDINKSNNLFNKQLLIVKDLEDYLKRLEIGQRKTNDSTLVKKYNTEIAKTQLAIKTLGTSGAKGLQSINSSVKTSTGLFTGLRSIISTTFAPLVAAAGVFELVSQVVSDVTNFEQSAADLSAITGATGDTLEFLKQSAVEVGTTTTVSASDTLEAYKLIASAKPELLGNAEALSQVTNEAIALAEAMGGELPVAATNLTDIMNQFQAPASQAGRFVNALAAGSKEGSAEVGDLAAAIVNAGAAARTANVNFEEVVGLTEGIAENGIKGAEAGTALRNIFSKLSATEILPDEAQERLRQAGVDMEALSDRSVSFTDRLRLLTPVLGDANALTSVFGLENQSAAQILIENVDRIDELTEAVTGTNTAYEQAEVRTSTVRGEFQKLRNTISAMVQGDGDGLASLLALLIRFIRDGLVFFGDVIDELRPSFSALGNSVGQLFSAISSLIPAQNEAAEGTSFWSKAIKLVSVPIEILFSILSVGINTISQLVTRTKEYAQSNIVLSKGFEVLRKVADVAFGVFRNLPGLVSGGLAAISTFVVETASSIGQLGRNIGNVLKEAFSFKKLITQGTGDLRSAVDDLLVNPFKDVGRKAAAAFNKEFNESQKDLEVEAKVTPVITDPDPVGAAPSGSTAASNSSAFVDPAEEKKRIQAAEKLENDIARARLQAMADGVDKQLALEQARFDDLIEKLDQYGIDSAQAVEQHERNKFEIRAKFLSDAADLEGLSGEDRVTFIFNQTKKEIDALESALKEANGGSLVESQIKQINLLRQNASREYIEALEKLQSEELQKAQQHEINLLELQRDGFTDQESFEEFKQKEILDIRLRFAEQQLALIEQVQGAESDAALTLRKTINELRGDIEALATTSSNNGFNLFELFGLDPNDPDNKKIIEGIQTAASTTIDVLNSINANRIAASDQAIDAANAEIDAIQELIDEKEDALAREQERAELGFATREQQIQDEILLLQEQQQAEKVERDKALAQKKKAQKEQFVLDTITQGSSLITAAAQIFNSVAAIPFLGPIIGASLVAAMLGSFAAAKVRVFKSIQQQKAEKGMYGEVKGRRHSEGGERFGDHIEVEDGESFGVLSRGATARHKDMHHLFVNALNKNDRNAAAKVYKLLENRFSLNPGLASSIEQLNRQADIELNVSNDNSAGIAETNRLLTLLLQDRSNPKFNRGATADGGEVISFGSFTRKIKK